MFDMQKFRQYHAAFPSRAQRFSERCEETKYYESCWEAWFFLWMLFSHRRGTRELVVCCINQKTQMLSSSPGSLIPSCTFNNLHRQKALRQVWNQGNIFSDDWNQKKSWPNCQSWYKIFSNKMQLEIYTWRLKPLPANSWLMMEVKQRFHYIGIRKLSQEMFLHSNRIHH